MDIMDSTTDFPSMGDNSNFTETGTPGKMNTSVTENGDHAMDTPEHVATGSDRELSQNELNQSTGNASNDLMDLDLSKESDTEKQLPVSPGDALLVDSKMTDSMSTTSSRPDSTGSGSKKKSEKGKNYGQ